MSQLKTFYRKSGFAGPKEESLLIFPGNHAKVTGEPALENSGGEENAKEKKMNGITATLRVRYYVMDLLYHNHNPLTRIPSSREIAAKFGIARSTARLALEQMVREGYLIGIPGKGTFLNPSSFSVPPRSAPRKIVGIKIRFGDQFLYLREIWDILSCQGFSLMERRFYARLLDNGSSSLDSMQEEVELYHLDAIIAWMLPDAEILRRLAKLIPVVSVGKAVEDIDCVIGRDTAKESIASLIRRYRCRRAFLLHSRSQLEMWTDFLKDIQFPGEIVAFEPLYSSEEDRLNREFLNSPPDLFIFNHEWAPWYAEFLQNNSVNPADILSIATNRPQQDNIRFPGWYINTPYQAMANSAARFLRNRIDNPETPRQTVSHDIVLAPWEAAES